MASPADGFDGYELVLGATRGIRQFGVNRQGFLTGVMHNTSPYKAGENLAWCWRQTSFHEQIYGKPHSLASCACGFYAYYDEKNRMYDGYGIAGIIEGYGKTVVGTKGFRSEKARVLALVIPEPYKPARWERWVINFKWAFWMLASSLLFLMFFLIATQTNPPWAIVFSVAVTPFLSAYLICFPGFVEEQVRIERRRTPHPHFFLYLQDRFLRQHYPDVEIFPTVEAMLKRYPLERPVTLDQEAA